MVIALISIIFSGLYQTNKLDYGRPFPITNKSLLVIKGSDGAIGHLRFICVHISEWCHDRSLENGWISVMSYCLTNKWIWCTAKSKTAGFSQSKCAAWHRYYQDSSILNRADDGLLQDQWCIHWCCSIGAQLGSSLYFQKVTFSDTERAHRLSKHCIWDNSQFLQRVKLETWCFYRKPCSNVSIYSLCTLTKLVTWETTIFDIWIYCLCIFVYAFSQFWAQRTVIRSWIQISVRFRSQSC